MSRTELNSCEDCGLNPSYPVEMCRDFKGNQGRIIFYKNGASEPALKNIANCPIRESTPSEIIYHGDAI